MSKVKQNWAALQSYAGSMRCAIGKAEKGSDAEDAYFLEYLERTANRLGYDIVKQS